MGKDADTDRGKAPVCAWKTPPRVQPFWFHHFSSTDAQMCREKSV